MQNCGEEGCKFPCCHENQSLLRRQFGTLLDDLKSEIKRIRHFLKILNLIDVSCDALAGEKNVRKVAASCTIPIESLLRNKANNQSNGSSTDVTFECSRGLTHYSMPNLNQSIVPLIFND